MTQQTSSTSNSRWRYALSSLVFLLGLVLLLSCAQFVVFARHDRDKLWTDYKNLPRGSVDVLFLGTSLVHANVNPAVLWGETGVRGYALSGSEQSLLTTLPYLDEALRTQKPQLVAVDLHMISADNASLSENQKRSNLTMMPLGVPKLVAVGATPAPEWSSYLIPLEQFHSRWTELQRKDFRPSKWRDNADDLFLGYRKVDNVEPQEPSVDTLDLDEDRWTENYKTLSRIVQRAQANDAEVLLLVGPSTRINLLDKWLERLKAKMARDYPDVRIIETQLRTGEMGIDYNTDYYDRLHLNSKGAEKYSRWLGQTLASEFALFPAKSDEFDAAWRGELERYRDGSGD